jgi:hypothetical protein
MLLDINAQYPLTDNVFGFWMNQKLLTYVALPHIGSLERLLK